MRSADYWQIFLDTGAPEMFLLYTQARRMEEIDVPDCTGISATGNGVQ